MSKSLAKRFAGLNVPEPVEIIHRPVISTGFHALDIALGSKGIVMGSMTELMGDRGSAKTTFSYLLAIQALKQYPDRPVVWCDTERSFDPTYAARLGLDSMDERFIFYTGSSFEKIFTSALQWLEVTQEDAIPSLLVLDSIANMNAQRLLTSGVFGDDVKARPGEFAKACQDFAKAASAMQADAYAAGRPQTAIVVPNQVREKIGGPQGHMGPVLVSPGGKNLHHNFSTTLRMGRVEPWFGPSGYEEGVTAKFRIVRNKYGAIPKLGIEVPIHFDLPLEKARGSNLLEEGLALGLIAGSGWLKFFDPDGNEHKVQGKDNFIKRILADEEFEAILQASIFAFKNGEYA